MTSQSWEESEVSLEIITWEEHGDAYVGFAVSEQAKESRDRHAVNLDPEEMRELLATLEEEYRR